MEGATGVPNPGYSVTLPPFATGDPTVDNVDYQPDPTLLGRLNVRFVLSEFDLLVEGLTTRTQIGETRVYENMVAKPRAWVQSHDGGVDKQADITFWSPNEIILKAQGPGTLTLAEIDYPGWRVSVDGEEEESQSIEGLLRGVDLAAGDHEVRFWFQPLSFYLGLVLCVLTVAVLVVTTARMRK